MTDSEMYMMIVKGMRGGFSQISHRYAKQTDEEPTTTTTTSSPKRKQIIYRDANNLYPTTMSDYPLPYGCFKWDERLFRLPEMTYEDCRKTLTNDSEVGYILEVDLIYPKHLHDMHNSYPLAPEHMTITKNHLSPYQKQIVDKLDINLTSNNKKLCATLNDIHQYTVYYKNLLLYMKQGMILRKIHGAIQFKQSDFFKSYVDFNTMKRKQQK